MSKKLDESFEQQELLDYIHTNDKCGLPITTKVKDFFERHICFKRDSGHNTTKIVCLCGSTKFKEAFETANREESLKGHIILTVAMFGHHEGLDMSGDAKKTFDELHLRKIELCDEVFVLNIGGYIGESTRREINYAKQISKPIRYLEND